VAAELIEARFPVMGSTGHLLVAGAAPTVLTWARSRLTDWEALWSRFRFDSEVCRLNASAGRWVELSEPTIALVRQAVVAWELTGGLFDPTILPALEHAGYTSTFEDLPAESPIGTAVPAPGCAGIEIGAGRVRLPPGVRIDLGGIGKGYAADLLAAELLSAGASGASVNLGGDVRTAGTPPTRGAWFIAVENESRPGTDLAWLALADGAVATSTRLRRRWRCHGQEAHHIIDPHHGAPASSAVASVTVVAADAHWAEVLAKAALIAGVSAGITLLESLGVAGLLVTGSGAAHAAGAWERYVTWTPDSGGISPAPVG
jgi:thiamine biosynthesis lipoprotein